MFARLFCGSVWVETTKLRQGQAFKIDRGVGFGDAKMTVLLDRFAHHCDIVEIGNESWRFKTRE